MRRRRAKPRPSTRAARRTIEQLDHQSDDPVRAAALVTAARAAVEAEAQVKAGNGQDERARRDMRSLMLSGASLTPATRQIMELHGLTRSRATELWKTIREDLRLAYAEDVQTLKAMQLSRLENDMMRARAQLAATTDPKHRRGAWQSVIELERLFSEVAGTKAPLIVQVNVDAVVRESLGALLSELTVEQLDSIAERQLEIETEGHEVG
jgi:hypothetical protein